MKKCAQLGLLLCLVTSHGTSVCQGTEFGKWRSGAILKRNVARSYGKPFTD